MIQLRSYQLDCVEKIRASYRAGHRAPLLVAPCGAGKTVIFAYIAANHLQKRGGRVTILVHRHELVEQVVRALREFGVNPGVIAAEYVPAYRNPVQVASVFTLVRRLDQVPPPTLVVVDECFSAETMVDGKPIQNFKIGDMVRSFNLKYNRVEHRLITHLFKSRPSTLCTVYLEDGRKFTCTHGHPFHCLERGYVEAINLSSGDEVSSMPRVPSGGPTHDRLPERESKKNRPRLLLKGLFKNLCFENLFGNHGKNKQKVRLGQNESSESDAKGGSKGENVSYSKKNRSRSETERREWEGAYDSAVTSPCFSVREGRNIHSRTSHPHAEAAWERISNLLQSGFGYSFFKAGDRSRRSEPLFAGEAISRHKKAEFIDGARVVRVEVHKPTADGTFGGMLPDGHVYNIEVEGNNNYFVDDVLVHNCHHAVSATTWGKVIQRYRQAHVLGVTATPVRLSGEGLDDIFDDLILGPTTQDLIDIGCLSPLVCYAPNSAELTNVHSRMGDFIRGELVKAVDRPTITGDAVTHYRKLANGLQTVVFCVSVEHAEHVASEFNASGNTAVSIDGRMHSERREGVIRDFRERRIKVLTSCDIISEGFDCPGIEVGISLRPTQSLGLWLQQCGRILRPSPGKSHAILLDHAGNTLRHGLPTDAHDWSLAGRSKETREGEAEPEPSVRICGQCFAANPSRRSTCSQCGKPFEGKPRQVEKEEGELEELTPEKLAVLRERREARRQQGSTKTLEALVQLGKMRGYAHPERWAAHVMEARASKGRA